jgi:acetolactate synthase-1/2/3 large subunit
LDVPLDVQGALIDPAKLKSFKKPTARHHIKQNDLKELVSRIRNAKRPLILAGHGIRCAGMVDEFEKLVIKATKKTRIIIAPFYFFLALLYAIRN